MPMAAADETVIFWGAGATKALGIRTTDEQGKFIRAIADDGEFSGTPGDRVAKALGDSKSEPWRSALVDLIRILGDRPESYDHIGDIDEKELDAMRRSWDGNKAELGRRILSLRVTYDWPALKSVVGICPGIKTGRFLLNDLFNVLDMHIPSGFGFPVPGGAADNAKEGDRKLQVSGFQTAGRG